jgi:Icc-related predicted phosphoesterase
MKVFATSDFHGNLQGLEPSGFDLCIIGGDYSPRWRGVTIEDQVAWMQREFIPWMAQRSSVQFVVVPGNHDIVMRQSEMLASSGWEFFGWPDNCKFLIDEGFEFGGLKIWGCPWIGPCGGRWAFEESSDVRLEARYDKIPSCLDILVCHNAPMWEWSGADAVMNTRKRCYEHSGSRALAKAIEKTMPRVVFCGHVHDGLHGDIWVDWKNGDGNRTYLYNVSRLDGKYQVRYEPRTIEILTRQQMTERDKR